MSGVDLAAWVIFLGYALLLIVWPCTEALLRHRWGWAIAVVLLSPLGGLLWLIFARRQRIAA
jgi:hypothetical protein